MTPVTRVGVNEQVGEVRRAAALHEAGVTPSRLLVAGTCTVAAGGQQVAVGRVGDGLDARLVADAAATSTTTDVGRARFARHRGAAT